MSNKFLIEKKKSIIKEKNAMCVAEKLGIKYTHKYNELMEKDIDNLYILSQNRYNAEDKPTFYWFYSNDIKKIVKFISQLKRHNLFEYITDENRKVYFDIDTKHIKNGGMNEKELYENVNNIIDKFNSFFGTNITEDDTIILYKRNKEQLINSYHLIFKKYMINYNVLNYFCEKELIDCYDKNMYKSKEHFSLKDNKKLSLKDDLLKEDYFEKENFKVLRDNNNENTDYLITYTKDCKLIEYELPQEIKEIIKKEKEKKKYKIVKKYDENTKRVNRFNIVRTFIEFLKKSDTNNFYDNNDWKYFLTCLKYNNCLCIEEFLKESVYNSNSNIHSLTNNTNYFNNDIDNFYEWNNGINKSMELQLKRINTKYDTSFYWDNNGIEVDDKLIEFISNKTNLTIGYITDKFIEYNNKKDLVGNEALQINNTYSYDLKKLILHNKETNETQSFITELYKNNDDDKHSNFINENNENIAKNALLFMDNGNKLFGCKIVWSGGKSYLVMKPVIKEAVKRNLKVLIYTENNSLNNDVYMDFKTIYINEKNIVNNHLNKKDFNDDYNIYITSLESSKKILHINFDIVILDEYESLLSHLESPTFKTEYFSAYECLIGMIDMMNKSKKIYCLDADLSNDRLQPIIKKLNIENKVELYKSNWNKWRDEFKYNISQDDENGTMDKILKDLGNGKNLGIGCMSKKYAKKVFNVIKKEYPNINILSIWSEEKKYHSQINIIEKKLVSFGNYETRELTQEEANDTINNMINKKDINVWIYTPSVMTGISYNIEFENGIPKPPRFHKTYMFCCVGSCNARCAIQMLHRIRDLQDKEININLQDTLGFQIPPPTEKQIESYLTNNIKFCKLEEDQKILLKYKFQDQETLKINDTWKKIKIVNMLEDWKSSVNLGYEIIDILYRHHNILPQMIQYTLKEERIKDLEKKIKYAGKKATEELVDLFVETEYLNRKEWKIQDKANHICNTNFKSIRECKKRMIIENYGLVQDKYKKNKSQQLINTHQEDIIFNNETLSFQEPKEDMRLFNNNDNTKIKSNNIYSNNKSLFVNNEWNGWKNNKEKYKHNGKVFNNEEKYELSNIDYFDKIGNEYWKDGYLNIYQNKDWTIENGCGLCNIFQNYKYLPKRDLNKINQKNYTYNNLIEKERSILSFGLDKENIEIIENINVMNNINKIIKRKKYETEEIRKNLNEKDLIEYDKNDLDNNNVDFQTLQINNFKKTKYIIKQFFPQLFNEDDKINFISLNIKVSEYNKLIDNNRKYINNNYTDILNLNNVIKKDIEIKDDKIFFILRDCLKSIGFFLFAPNNKKNMNDKYIIIPNTIIYSNYTNKREIKDYVKIIVNGNTESLYINNFWILDSDIKNGKSTIHKEMKKSFRIKKFNDKKNTKETKTDRYKKTAPINKINERLKDINLSFEEIDLYKKEYVKWNDGIKTNHYYYDNIQPLEINEELKKQKNKIEKEDYIKLFVNKKKKHNFNINYWLRFHPRVYELSKNQEEVKKQYNDKLQSGICLINDEAEEEDIIIEYTGNENPLDKGVCRDTDESEENELYNE